MKSITWMTWKWTWNGWIEWNEVIEMKWNDMKSMEMKGLSEMNDIMHASDKWREWHGTRWNEMNEINQRMKWKHENEWMRSNENEWDERNEMFFEKEWMKWTKWSWWNEVIE